MPNRYTFVFTDDLIATARATAAHHRNEGDGRLADLLDTLATRLAINPPAVPETKCGFCRDGWVLQRYAESTGTGMNDRMYRVICQYCHGTGKSNPPRDDQ